MSSPIGDASQAGLRVRGRPVVAIQDRWPTTPERAATELAEAGAAAVGANCGHGIEARAAVVAEPARHAAVPVAVRSNAGLP
jgi:hypothetical protein